MDMPYNDGTGPMGRGAGTGRGMGPCGAGLQRGRGRCMGFRGFFSPKNSLAALEAEETMLKEELQAVQDEKAALKGQQK